MAVLRKSDGALALVRLEIRPDEIPDLLARHRSDNSGTRQVEELGRKLVQGGFAPASSARFVKSVCEWGGGHRLVKRALEENAPVQIARVLKRGLASALKGCVADGVEQIQALQGLGQSFASKQLRFLAPDRAVILDSFLRTELGYPENSKGYQAFLADCEAILAHARTSTQLTAQFRNRLRVCDVEAALFAKIRGL